MSAAATPSSREHAAGGPVTPSLEGKLAVVTGGTRGIGRAIAAAMRARGAAVIATGTKIAGGVPAGCRFVQLKLEDRQSVESLCRLILHEAPHILVNNAALSSAAAVENADMDEVLRVHETNLMAPLRLCQAAVLGMKRHGWGRIVNITAVPAAYGRKGRAIGGSSKAALEAMTASLAAEYAPYGILANCVAPGFIETEALRALYSAAQVKALAEIVPVKRLGTPEEVASLVVWLTGPENGYLTGQHLFADGGFGRVR
jgi:NAD(P)-dependent dehydrogenase (short-subunit alcohol dehydrogenase family)